MRTKCRRLTNHSEFKRFLKKCRRSRTREVCTFRFCPEPGFYRPLLVPNICEKLEEINFHGSKDLRFVRVLCKLLEKSNTSLKKLSLPGCIGPSIFFSRFHWSSRAFILWIVFIRSILADCFTFLEKCSQSKSGFLLLQWSLAVKMFDELSLDGDLIKMLQVPIRFIVKVSKLRKEWLHKSEV